MQYNVIFLSKSLLHIRNNGITKVKLIHGQLHVCRNTLRRPHLVCAMFYKFILVTIRRGTKNGTHANYVRYVINSNLIHVYFHNEVFSSLSSTMRMFRVPKSFAFFLLITKSEIVFKWLYCRFACAFVPDFVPNSDILTDYLRK